MNINLNIDTKRTSAISIKEIATLLRGVGQVRLEVTIDAVWHTMINGNGAFTDGWTKDDAKQYAPIIRDLVCLTWNSKADAFEYNRGKSEEQCAAAGLTFGKTSYPEFRQWIDAEIKRRQDETKPTTKVGLLEQVVLMLGKANRSKNAEDIAMVKLMGAALMQDQTIVTKLTGYYAHTILAIRGEALAKPNSKAAQDRAAKEEAATLKQAMEVFGLLSLNVLTAVVEIKALSI